MHWLSMLLRKFTQHVSPNAHAYMLCRSSLDDLLDRAQKDASTKPIITCRHTRCQVEFFCTQRRLIGKGFDKTQPAIPFIWKKILIMPSIYGDTSFSSDSDVESPSSVLTSDPMVDVALLDDNMAPGTNSGASAESAKDDFFRAGAANGVSTGKSRAVTKMPEASQRRPLKCRAHRIAASTVVKVIKASPRCRPGLVVKLETNVSNFACSRVAPIIALFRRWFGRLQMWTVTPKTSGTVGQSLLATFIGSKDFSPEGSPRPGGGFIVFFLALMGGSNPGGGSRPGGSTTTACLSSGIISAATVQAIFTLGVKFAKGNF